MFGGYKYTSIGGARIHNGVTVSPKKMCLELNVSMAVLGKVKF